MGGLTELAHTTLISERNLHQPGSTQKCYILEMHVADITKDHVYTLLTQL